MAKEGLASPRPPGWRWQYIWPPIGIAVALVFGTTGFLLRPKDQKAPRPVSPTSSTVPIGSQPSLVSPSTFAQTASTVPAQTGDVLGRDIQPAQKNDCRAPSVGTGAAWRVIKAEVGTVQYDIAYSCNLFAGQAGSLDFVLGKTYVRFMLAIGFDNASIATGHRVKFEVIADGNSYLAEPTILKLGETRRLDLSVKGVTRLSLKITESSGSSKDTAPSLPVFAMPTLLRG